MSDDDRARLAELIQKLRRRRKPPVPLYGPVDTDELDELEAKLGAPLPDSVRCVYEQCNGNIDPLSPMRPDCLIASFAHYEEARDGVVPIVDLGIDPESGLQRGYGVAIADPWGLLKERTEDGYIDADFTLVEWFEMIAKEITSYDWPAPRTITLGAEWTPCSVVDEAELAAASVGTAIALRVPKTKKNRVALELFVLVEPDRWVRSLCRAEKDMDSRPLEAMCASATEDIPRMIARHPSQWALTVADVARPRRERDVFRGTARIELA